MNITIQKVEARMSRSVRTPGGVPVPVCPTVQFLKLKRDKQTVRYVLRSCPPRQDLTRSLPLFCSLVNTLVLLRQQNDLAWNPQTLFRCQRTRRSLAYMSINKYS